jgi:hypothetical protein
MLLIIDEHLALPEKTTPKAPKMAALYRGISAIIGTHSDESV